MIVAEYDCFLVVSFTVISGCDNVDCPAFGIDEEGELNCTDQKMIDYETIFLN